MKNIIFIIISFLFSLSAKSQDFKKIADSITNKKDNPELYYTIKSGEIFYQIKNYAEIIGGTKEDFKISIKYTMKLYNIEFKFYSLIEQQIFRNEQ